MYRKPIVFHNPRGHFESFLSATIEGVLLSITLGMLLFIVVDELLPKVIKNKKNKALISGIITGVIILLISMIW